MILAESGQEVLESIGLKRYYSQHFLDEGVETIPDFVKEYRLGLHKPGEKPEIKLVKVKK